MSATNGHAMTTTMQVLPPEGRAVDASIIERVIAVGDLSRMQPHERVAYYVAVCRSVGLNPLTRPFEYINLNGKLTLYALKNCTDQLRQIHGVSVDKLRRETHEGIHIVTAEVSARDGRRDEDIGAVSIKGLAGEALANGLMKATTKAKRRSTLSICGLSFVDESELESMPHARRVQVTEEGEIIDEKPSPLTLEKQLAASVEANWPAWEAKWIEQFKAATDLGELNELWADCYEERRKLKPPREVVDRLALAKDTIKVLFKDEDRELEGADV